MDANLDATVHDVDEDRWLAVRFATKAIRPKLIAIYAVNAEIARTAWASRSETLGDIRLAWWREAIEAVHAGGPTPSHPALAAYAESAPNETMLEAWRAMLDARERDAESVPFETWPDLQAYVEATAGGVFRIAVEACLDGDARHKQTAMFAAKAGQAWGYCGLVRALPFWKERNSTFFPRRLLEHVGIDPAVLTNEGSNHAMRSAAMAVVDRARHAYREAQDLASVLPAAAFPAIGYLSLAPRYLRAVSMPHADINDSVKLSLLVRQLALVKASAMGRV